MKIVYIVICCCNGHEYYEIDSVWTSERKAEKRWQTLLSIDVLYGKVGELLGYQFI